MTERKDGTSPDYTPLREHYTEVLHKHWGDWDDTWLDQLLEKAFLVAETTDLSVLFNRLNDLENLTAAWMDDIDTRRAQR